MVTCDVTFANSTHGVYYSGQTLEGQVTLTLEKPKTIRSIFVIIRGQAKCEWREARRLTHKFRVYRFHSEEEFLSSLIYVAGSPDSDSFELPIGVHNYNITCILPPQLPSSFEGRYGSIRYTIKVVIDRPWKFDHTFKQAFTVLRPYDLNFDRTIQLPIRQEKIKTFCCFPCASPPLKFVVKLPHSGFASGQTIPILVEVDNKSGIAIEKLKYSLKKIVRYHAISPRYKTKVVTERIVDDVGDRSIPATGDVVFTHNLKIPPVAPSIHDCKILSIAYELKVKGISTGCHYNPKVVLPIVIGTVPIYPHLAGQHYRPDDPNIKPPTFEECIYGKQTIVDADDGRIIAIPFAPLYPVFDFDVNVAPPSSQIHAPDPVTFPVAGGSHLSLPPPEAVQRPFKTDHPSSPYQSVPSTKETEPFLVGSADSPKSEKK